MTVGVAAAESTKGARKDLQKADEKKKRRRTRRRVSRGAPSDGGNDGGDDYGDDGDDDYYDDDYDDYYYYAGCDVLACAIIDAVALAVVCLRHENLHCLPVGRSDARAAWQALHTAAADSGGGAAGVRGGLDGGFSLSEFTGGLRGINFAPLLRNQRIEELLYSAVDGATTDNGPDNSSSSPEGKEDFTSSLARALFEGLNRDGDGKLSFEEFGSMRTTTKHEASSAFSSGALQPAVAVS